MRLTPDSCTTLPFGKLQGVAPGGIPAYSNARDDFFSGEKHIQHQLFMGYKFQCVEFARRWLFHRKGLVLPDTPTAHKIFSIRTVFDATSAAPEPMQRVHNGTAARPVADSLIIFPVSKDCPFGHVGVITHVEKDCVYVADQNYHFRRWDNPKGLRLALRRGAGENGEETWTIHDERYNLTPRGWMTFPTREANRKAGAPAPVVHPTLRYRPQPASPSPRPAAATHAGDKQAAGAAESSSLLSLVPADTVGSEESSADIAASSVNDTPAAAAAAALAQSLEQHGIAAITSSSFSSSASSSSLRRRGRRRTEVGGSGTPKRRRGPVAPSPFGSPVLSATAASPVFSSPMLKSFPSFSSVSSLKKRHTASTTMITTTSVFRTCLLG